jgi:hypothetical protein
MWAMPVEIFTVYLSFQGPQQKKKNIYVFFFFASIHLYVVYGLACLIS